MVKNEICDNLMDLIAGIENVEEAKEVIKRLEYLTAKLQKVAYG